MLYVIKRSPQGPFHESWIWPLFRICHILTPGIYLNFRIRHGNYCHGNPISNTIPGQWNGPLMHPCQKLQELGFFVSFPDSTLRQEYGIRECCEKSQPLELQITHQRSRIARCWKPQIWINGESHLCGPRRKKHYTAKSAPDMWNPELEHRKCITLHGVSHHRVNIPSPLNLYMFITDTVNSFLAANHA